MLPSIGRTRLSMLFVLFSLGSFLFSQSQRQVGYALLTADSGSSIPVGSALFSYNDSQGNLVSQAGVGAAEPILSGRIYVDETGTQTGIALVNPSAQTATYSLTLRNAKGDKVDSITRTLAAGAHLPIFAFQLFKNLSASFTGSLTFESDQKLAAITLRQTLNAAGEPLYTTLPVVDLALPPSYQSVVFPHIAAGGGYITQVLLINTTAQKITGSISLTDPDGQHLLLQSNGTTDWKFSYAIEPNGVFRADFDRPAGLATGYALVSPDSGSAAPAGSAVFQVKQNGSLVTEAGVGAIQATTSARIFVDDVGSYTGVAVANPSDQAAVTTFSLLDHNGSLLDSTTRTLPVRGQLAIFAFQLFPGMSNRFTGLMEINSTSAVVPITLKQTGQVLTTLPVADLTRLSTAQSVIFAQIAIGEGFSTRLIFINVDKTKAVTGKLNFYNSDASAMTVPLGSKTASQFSYQITEGGGRQYFPGNTAKVASISLLDPVTGLSTSEAVVNEGQSVRLSLLVLDTTGLIRDDFDLTYSSLSTDVASVDNSGNVQGKKAGFSTLAILAGDVITTGTITVVAVSSGTTGFTITGLAQDLARRLYLANTNDHAILLAQDLKQTPAVYAGVSGSAGFKDAARLQSLFRNPSFLALDQSQASLFVSDTANHAIRRVYPGAANKVETLAGTGTAGSQDGSANAASFNNPQGITLDNKGYLWVADSGNHTIRRINLTTGMVETIAGKAGSAGSDDGAGNKARFNSPGGIALETESLAQQLEREAQGKAPPPVSILVADTGNGVIRRVKETGDVETISSSTLSASPSQRARSAGMTASAAAPLIFRSPTGIQVDSMGSIYVSEPSSKRVRIILQNGAVLPTAQPNTFTNPKGIVITQNGKVVVADQNKSAREISYGEPQITSITPSVIGNKGGERVTVLGSNFAAETVIVLAGVLVTKLDYLDSQKIIFTAPALLSGRSTLTLQNRAGLAQKPLSVDAVPLSALSSGQITTVAGGATFAGDGSAASTARLSLPIGVAFDKSGNVFIADRDNHRIRKVSVRTGIITTVAGTGQQEFSGDNGPAIAAALYGPEGVAVDRAGNLLILDSGNERIRRVSADTGIIVTVAGGGDPQDGLGDNGPATAAALSEPSGIALDQADNLYIADTGGHRIRKVDAKTRIITTVVGNGREGFAGDKKLAINASLKSPERIAFDAAGNLFIADTGNSRVRWVDATTGIIDTVAGNGEPNFSGDGGPASAAQVDPSGVAVDVEGNIYIADRANDRIRKVDSSTHIITTMAGNGDSGSGGDNGPATAASLRFVHGIAVDAAGNLLIADSGNHRIRVVSALTRIITTLAGGEASGFLGDDGPATAASLNTPVAAVADAYGNLYIADSDNNRVRRIDALSRKITTFAGTGEETLSGVGGPATLASFVATSGVAMDTAGNVYIAAEGNSRVFRVDLSTGILTTVAGSDAEGYSGDNGLATLAALDFPDGIALDGVNNLFIADTLNNRIRKVDAATKIISTVAGGGSVLGDNGLATAATLNEPRAVAFNKQGDLFIADTLNHRIRKVSTSGIITTIAGTGQGGYSGDGQLATAAELFAPKGLAVDDLGNLFIADGNNVIRRVDAKTRLITTIVGNGDFGASGDNGPASAATLGFPFGVSLDANGNLFIADSYNHRIRAVRGPIQ